MDSRDFCGRQVSGLFPEYGAIFMSNRTTFRECMKKSLLGLPDSFSGFVERVKAGMILFLFEFEDRKLHGVFEALSDGGMNIVPYAYKSSGKRYPAQVKFTTIWRCKPLYENEFRDAIRDNFFSKHKFRFGLSKDQVQSLLSLFNEKKLQIPNSPYGPHHPKRKKRKRDHKSVESGLGNFTEIRMSRWKPDMDEGVSVISEPDRESLSFSSDSVKKSESIHFDVEAYDPEHPGFHHSEGSGTPAAGHEISAEETEDFIPLLSPDHADPEEEVFDDSEWPVEKQQELDISIPVPQLPLKPVFSNEGSNHSKSLPTNGMYSDNAKKRASVFSRLRFSSKSENQNDEKGEVEGCTVDKRTSVFLRLAVAPDAVSQQVHCMPEQKEEIGEWKKGRKKNNCSEWTCYNVDKILNQSQNILASEYDVEADGFRQNMSVPEILEKLLQRHAIWEGYGWRT